MCEPASFVVIKDNGSYIAYWSKNSDSHEVIKKENGLDKLDVDNVRGDYRMIPVEITPPDNDFRLPLKKWVFRAEVVPEWADMADVEVACRVQLKDWLSAKVVLPNEEKERINLGQIVAIYGKVEYISGSAQVEYISGSAQVKYISGSAQVKHISGSAQVKYISGSAQVKHISGSAQVEYIYGSAQVEYISGSAQVEYIYGSAQVKHISGSAQVEYISGSAVITTYNNLSPDILKSSKAVMIDRSKDVVQCFVGKDL